jgi:hypothetical protein
MTTNITTTRTKPPRPGIAITLPDSPGGTTVSETNSETDDHSRTNTEPDAQETSRKPCSPLLPGRNPQKRQAALTRFYQMQPLHLIRSIRKAQNSTNQKAHNSIKRRNENLSTQLPPYQSAAFSNMDTITPPAKRQNTRSHGLIVQVPIPDARNFRDMALLSGDITPRQMELAWSNSLHFLGYELPPTVTPATAATVPAATINLLDSPLRQDDLFYNNPGNFHPPSPPPAPLPPPPVQFPQPPAQAPQPPEEVAFTQARLNSFTPDHAAGSNIFVDEVNCQRVLNIYYGLRPRNVEPLILNRDINTMEHLFALAAEIAGTVLNQRQLKEVCVQPATHEVDPAARFNNAAIPGLGAIDANHYTPKDILLYDIFCGQHGVLYSNADNQPPKNCVIVMKIKATIPNVREPVIDHAIFLPDVLMLITVNAHVDTKDKYKRVRNAWQVRREYLVDVLAAQPAKKHDHCNRRLTGKIFGGGDGSSAELLRAAVLYSKPDNRKQG